MLGIRIGFFIDSGGQAIMRKINDIGQAIVRQIISAQSLINAQAKSRLPLRGLASYITYLRSIRSGSKTSRIFRHMFEHKHAKRVLGSNLAFLVLASSFVPSVGSFYSDEWEQNVYQAETIQLSTDVSIRYPLEYLQINQGYHLFHLGIDFEGITGDPIYPIMNGTVEVVEYSYYGYGNSIIVNHENGLSSRYAHLSKVNVNVGEKVDTFKVIGEVGSTGRSSGDHLHLEVYSEGRNINPLSFLSIN